jgi:hypothetical protein
MAITSTSVLDTFILLIRPQNHPTKGISPEFKSKQKKKPWPISTNKVAASDSSVAFPVNAA